MTDIEECKTLFNKIGVKYYARDNREAVRELIIESPYWCAFEFNAEGKFVEVFVTE